MDYDFCIRLFLAISILFNVILVAKTIKYDGAKKEIDKLKEDKEHIQNILNLMKRME